MKRGTCGYVQKLRGIPGKGSPEFRKKLAGGFLLRFFRPNISVFGVFVDSSMFVVASRMNLDSLASKGGRERRFRRVRGNGGGKLPFSPQTYEDGKDLVLQFRFCQFSPCNF